MSQQQPTESVLLMDELLSAHLFSSSSEPTSSVHSPPSLQPPPPPKRKRSLPGHPDPDSEVIALSPKSLLATNRFMCEICNKGFQRDQNLQLHRRGHNLPWKLKQRPKDEAVKKKVYVCPEPGCVHNDPARALGDLTGIKKHFYRKHGEKKWKCEKCSKKYAVQSDWKAHSKSCGTKEYKCDCGTIFSRRDSFITHRAFCDALVEDTARAITSNPFLPPPPPPPPQKQEEMKDPHQSPAATSSPPMFILQNQNQQSQLIPQQQESSNHHTHIPNFMQPWLCQQPSSSSSPSPALLFSDELMQPPPHQNPNVTTGGPTLYAPPPPAQPHMSATALLQKAAQLGAIVSSKTNPFPSSLGFFNQVSGGPGNAIAGGSGGGFISSSSPSSLLFQDMMMKAMPSSLDGDNMNVGFGNNGGISDGLTRDFLGLSPLITHADIFNINVAGLADANANSSPRASLKRHGDILCGKPGDI